MNGFEFIPSLSGFMKNQAFSFWNGDGSLRLVSSPVLESLAENPGQTFAGISNDGNRGLVQAGVEFGVSGDRDIALGDNLLKIAIGAEFNFDAFFHIIMASNALADLTAGPPIGLEEILNDSDIIALEDGVDGLTIFTLRGKVGASIGAAIPILAGNPNLNVGFSIKGGGDYEWANCSPIKLSDVVLPRLKEAVASSRLPQNRLPSSQALQNNEFLFNRYTGFLKLGVEASAGYAINGAGIQNDLAESLDIKTQLSMQAKARLSMDYQLAGAFQVIVTDVKNEDRNDWVRVIVRRDRSSRFDLGLGIAVGVKAESQDPPTALALFEAVLGVESEQVIGQVRGVLDQISDLDEFKSKADGILTGLVEGWLDDNDWFKPTAERADAELKPIFDGLKKIAATLGRADDYLIGLYDRLRGVTGIDERLREIEQLLQNGDPKVLQQGLLDMIDHPLLKALLESLTGKVFAVIYANIEEYREELLSKVTRLRTLVDGDAKEAIEKFLDARFKAFGLDTIVRQIGNLNSIEELRAEGYEKLKEMVNRLIDKSLDQIFDSDEAKEAFEEVMEFADGFKAFLRQADEMIKKALNAKGRFELSYAYRREHETDRLIDIEIDVNAIDGKGLALYNEAVSGNFTDVFKDENLPYIHIRKAGFTDKILTQKTMGIHIFGWDFKSTSSILKGLEGSVEVGKNGLITLYRLYVNGERISESSKRDTQLRYLFEVVGTAEGAVLASGVLKDRAISAQKGLAGLQNGLSYTIKDQITHKDELESYLLLGVKTGILTVPEVKNLMVRIRSFNWTDEGGGNFGNVAVTYTFTFGGKALSNAIAHQFYAGDSEDDHDSGANRHALEKLFVDRLIASFNPKPTSTSRDLAIYAAYKHDDIYDRMRNGEDPLNRYDSRSIYVPVGDVLLNIDPNPPEARAMDALYVANRRIAETIDELGTAIRTGTTISLDDLSNALAELADRFGFVDEYTSPSNDQLQAVPVLLLDEMVKISSGAQEDARTSLLEITLTNSEGTECYIPIAG